MANTQINISGNGTTTLATAGKFCDRNIDVNVTVPASGITPTGTKTITTNGTHDVTSYASVTVNVQQETTPKMMEVHNITISSVLGNGTNTIHPLLTGNAFLKEHYTKDTFAAFLYAKSPVATATKMSHSLYHGNANIGSSNVVRYGFSYCGSSASALGFVPVTNKISTNGYSVSFRTTSAGNLSLYVASDRQVPAGEYVLVLMNWGNA